MAASREVKVTIVGDSDSMVRAFRNADKAATGFGRGGSALMATGMGLVAGGAAAAAQAIGTGLVIALKTGISEMQEQEKVSAQTSAALKSTGNAAGVTKAHIESLAGSLQAQTGTQDDAIQSSENLLLTFNKISNKGPDKMFDRATKAALDLSVAFHKDLNGSSVMVGKALQDPVKGVSALSRVGVSFSASQKTMIKSLVETGQTAKAQKLILHELETQVGGSAKAFGETTPGQIEKAKRAFEDLSQGAVQAVAPIGAAILPALVTAMRGTVTWFQTNWPRIKEVAMQIYQWFQVNLLPGFKEVGRGIGSIVVSIVGIFRQYWPQIMAVVRPVIDNLKTTIVTAMNVVKGVINLISSLLKGDFSGAWRALTGIVGAVLRGIVIMLKNLVLQIVGIAVLAGKAALNIGLKIVEGIGQGIVGLAKLAGRIVQGLAGALASAVVWVGTKFVEIGSAIVEGIKSGIAAAWDGFKGWLLDKLGSPIQWAKDFFGIGSPSRVFAKQVGEPIVQGIAQGIQTQQGNLKNKLVTVMKNAVSSAKSNLISLSGTFGGLLGTARTAGDSGLLGVLQGNLTADQNKRQKQALDDAKAQADADVIVKQSALSTAEDQVQAQKDLTDAIKAAADAQIAIEDFARQQEINDLQSSIDKRKAKYQEDTDNLAAQFALGQISAQQFQNSLNDLIGGDTGEALGAAFALNFKLALQGVMDQLAEINKISGSAGVEPSGPSVEKPTQTWKEALASVRSSLESQWSKAHKDGDVNSDAAQSWVDKKMAAWKKNHAAQYGIALAGGGIVNAATMALIGEAGPEAIIPLSSPKAKEMLSGAGVGGGNVINLTFNGVLDAKDAARALRPELDRLVRLAV